jgi:hypothetical protein
MELKVDWFDTNGFTILWVLDLSQTFPRAGIFHTLTHLGLCLSVSYRMSLNKELLAYFLYRQFLTNDPQSVKISF